MIGFGARLAVVVVLSPWYLLRYLLHLAGWEWQEFEEWKRRIG